MRTYHIKLKTKRNYTPLLLWLTLANLFMLPLINYNLPIKAEKIKKLNIISSYKPPRTPEKIKADTKPIKKTYTWTDYLYENTDKPTAELIERIAYCESRYNPTAINSNEIIINNVSYGHASGLFQYLPSTWTGYKCTGDIWNAMDQIKCTIDIIHNKNGIHNWNASKSCWNSL